MYFANRKDAGQKLAEALAMYRGKPDVIVLALPRGGVPVAFEISEALHLPLDVILVRKLGVPGHEELAMGAIANGNVRVLNEDVIRHIRIPECDIEEVAAMEHEELVRRNKAYREGRKPPKLSGKTVILVDDGAATGANMRAAISAVSHQKAGRIVVAVPVASDSAYELLREVADEVICLEIPDSFYGVGRFYKDFSQTSDVEVRRLLRQSVREEKVMLTSCVALVMMALIVSACSDSWLFKPYNYQQSEDARLQSRKLGYSIQLGGEGFRIKKKLETPIK